MNSFCSDNLSFLFTKGLSSLPFFLGYAEIHYRLGFLKPRYYRKIPEIIADVPIRAIKKVSEMIPILLIVKDADLFPIIFRKVRVEIETREKREKKIQIKIHK